MKLRRRGASKLDLRAEAPGWYNTGGRETLTFVTFFNVNTHNASRRSF